MPIYFDFSFQTSEDKIHLSMPWHQLMMTSSGPSSLTIYIWMGIRRHLSNNKSSRLMVRISQSFYFQIHCIISEWKWALDPYWKNFSSSLPQELKEGFNFMVSKVLQIMHHFQCESIAIAYWRVWENSRPGIWLKRFCVDSSWLMKLNPKQAS